MNTQKHPIVIIIDNEFKKIELINKFYDEEKNYDINEDNDIKIFLTEKDLFMEKCYEEYLKKEKRREYNRQYYLKNKEMKKNNEK